MASTASHVVSVDWFRGDEYTGPAFTLPEAYANLYKYNALDNVTLCVGNFMSFLSWLKLADFGMAFYDADHTYETTAAALSVLLRSINGPVAVHDYDPKQPMWVDAIRAVDEAARAYDRRIRVVDRMAVLEF